MNTVGQTMISLKVTARDIRAIAVPPSPQRQPLPARAVAGVEAIIRRYANQSALPPHLQMTLQLVAGGVTLQNVHNRTIVHLAPRLALTILNWAGADANKSTNKIDPDRPKPVLKIGHPVETDVVRQRRLVLAEMITKERLVQRLIARERRHETVASTRDKTSGPAGMPVNRVRAIPTVVVRPSAPVAERQVSPEPPQPLATHRQQAIGPIAPDVNLLAEQVMQTIDRRMTAYRERTGRV